MFDSAINTTHVALSSLYSSSKELIAFSKRDSEGRSFYREQNGSLCKLEAAVGKKTMSSLLKRNKLRRDQDGGDLRGKQLLATERRGTVNEAYLKKGALTGNKNWQNYKRNSMMVIQPGQHLPQSSVHGGVPNRRSSIQETLSSL